MAETITFTGRVRFFVEAKRYAVKKPITVEVWDDDADERDERLERQFSDLIEAERYAHGLTGKTVAIPLDREDDHPSMRRDPRWSAPTKITGAL